MIEPTESEDKAEIDRFCDALIAIREEIKAIENGSADTENNVLRNAPHTHRLLLEGWTLPYSNNKPFSLIIINMMTNTGRQSGVLITFMATDMWCAPARLWRIMSEG